jgi:predicted RNase H-like nuclease (RuvC/YqgF family)
MSLENYRPTMNFEVLHSWASDTQKEIERLEAELENYRGVAMVAGADKALADYYWQKTEIDRLKGELEEKQIYTLDLERQLSRYKEGVEAEGYVFRDDTGYLCIDWKQEPHSIPIGQNVRVLVMKG